jgi:serine/threonine protein kinase
VAPLAPMKDLPIYIYDERFHHIGVVGCGAYGEVYKVKHRETGKIYAIKKYKNIFKNRILALRTLR